MRNVEWMLLSLGMILDGIVPSAQAGHWHIGVGDHVRPHCITDWYGWHAPVVGFDSSYFLSSGGFYRSSFSGARYAPWGWAPVVYPVYPSVVVQQTTVPIDLTIVNPPRDPAFARPRAVVADPFQQKPLDVFDVVQQHAEKRANIPPPPGNETVVRPVSGSSRAGKERSQKYQAEGDRWLREGQNVKAYLRYLEAQREAEDRGEVYFRQAYVLVAMGRYSHAVSKLKRGLQVDPTLAKRGQTLDEVFGVKNVDQKVDYLRRVADWTNADVSDPDRLFLMGVLLHFDEDSRAGEFLNAAWKLAGRGQHIQAFLQSPSSPPKEIPTAAIAKGRLLPMPPPPRDDPAVEADARELRAPRLTVPPEPARRELILPDVYLPEESR